MLRSRPLATATALATLAVETAVVFGTSLAARVDTAVYVRAVQATSSERARRATGHLVSIGAPATVAVAGFALSAAAWAIRGPRDAARCGAVIVGATATTQVLQALLDRPRELSGHGFISSLYPSGHVTGVAAVSICAAMLVDERARPAAIAAGTVAVGLNAVGMIVRGAHLLSDVVAALLVVAIWGAAVGPRPAS